jgi:hypothetical protein
VSTTSLHLTASGQDEQGERRVTVRPVVPPDAIPEERLTLLLAGTQATRHARAAEAAALLAAADPGRLITLLERLRVTVLFGQRLIELVGDVGTGLGERITACTERAREHGRIHDLATLSILAELERDGIRALPLKGSALARELYGDVGTRSSGDIDILVDAGDLKCAIASVERAGWRWQPQPARATALPVLHETLSHARLPRVELHWRVHWYETRFAADALGRARSAGPHQPLIMAPPDGLAALTLFYARDGFAGLRMAADAAAWWDAVGKGGDAGRSIHGTARCYPELAGPLLVGARLLASLVGLPARLDDGPFRWRVAANLATPLLEKSTPQLRANAGLADLLLAPPNGHAASLRRERQKIPENMERPLTREDNIAVHRARWEHLLRVTRRWALAFIPAAFRAYRGRGAPY